MLSRVSLMNQSLNFVEIYYREGSIHDTLMIATESELLLMDLSLSVASNAYYSNINDQLTGHRLWLSQ